MPQLKLDNSLVDDRYEVYERLSLGSYAEIFVARDRQAGGKEVVIKALNPSLQGTPDADLEQTLIENFQNEAVALDTLRHQHIILRLGHGTAADLNGVPFHYLVLEYLPGGDLLKLCRTLAGNALDLETALFFFKQACEALAFAHSKGVIHRDLKPNNFLLTADHKTLKVADFGVAKLTSDENAEITRVGADIYAPPEHHPDQSHGKVGRLTASADIYSLAKSFYTIVSGRTPSQFSRLPVSSLPENIASRPWSADLLHILNKATADSPDDRFPTVVEFWSRLASLAAIPALPVTESDSDATRVRPREVSGKLDVSPLKDGKRPDQPEFASLMNSTTGSRSALSQEKIDRVPVVEAGPPTKRKFVVNIDEKNETAAPVVSKSSGPQAIPREKKPEPTPEPVNDSFMAPVGRRIAVGVVAGLFLMALFGVYRYARSHRVLPQNPIAGVTNPARQFLGEQLEVVAPDLNVRTGPGPGFDRLGAITHGTRHKVLQKAENGWIEIEVSEWSPNYDHTLTQKQGWVNGDTRLVKLGIRGLW